MSKKALGKGLDALIQGEPPTHGGGSAVARIPLDRISSNPSQPRKDFDGGALAELADSIRARGVIQPIIVEEHGDGYRLIAGERRYRAAKLAGLREIPAIVASYNEDEKLQVSLIENIQREDLNPVEEARAYEALLERSGMSQEELARHVGKNRSTIANSLRLLRLPEDVLEALREGGITAGHARAILAVSDAGARRALFRRIVAEGLSVREAEALAEKPGARPKSGGPRRAAPESRVPEIRDMEQSFIESLGTKVKIRGGLDRGSIEIDYYSMDDLERLYDLISGRRSS